MSVPVGDRPEPPTLRQEAKQRFLGVLRFLLVLYAVVGVVGSVASLFIDRAPDFDSSPLSAAPDFGDDVADSWNRFNADDASAPPSWTVDQLEAAAGDVRGGESSPCAAASR